MSAISFADAQKTFVVTPKVSTETEAPFDPRLNYNRIIQPAGGMNKFPTRSIDAGSILKKLEGDKISHLRKITLACSYTRTGLMMWDAHTNLMNIAGWTSCIFLADKDFNPVPRERTVSSSQFLNYEHAGARLRLNRVDIGDKIGIGIYNSVRRTSYILIYEVKSNTVAQDTNGAKGDRPMLIHGVNCELLQVYRFNEKGDGDRIDIGDISSLEDVSHTLQSFVGYLVNTVMDILNSYPWKAHFIPVNVNAWDRDAIEARISSEYTDVELGDYDAFEAACRSVYNEARAIKIASLRNKERAHGNKNKNTETTTERPKAPLVPTVEVITLNDTGMILAKLRDENNDNVYLFRFPKDSIADACVTETFLTNADLEGTLITENANVLNVTESVFGESATVRYFTANF